MPEPDQTNADLSNTESPIPSIETIDGIPESIASTLATKGFTSLTPVQLAVIEPSHRDVDLLVSAQTGTGKTVAFGLAIAQGLLAESPRVGRASAPLALVVAPTRELALQVQRELNWLYRDAGATVVSCVGGMDVRDERRALGRGAHIVVGTPGRLVDHIGRGALALDSLQAVVLDEADEMLDLGFRDDLEQILSAAPEERRTLLFSATVSPAITRLAKNFQKDAVRVSTLAERAQHSDIQYHAVLIAQHDQENAIINLLRYHAEKKALVFCSTRATVSHLSARLTNRGFAVATLSGELSQRERGHALQMMRDGKARVCVATDVAARGIDLPDLDLVIHADPPRNTEALLHRSGRTGRAGRKGESVLIAPRRGKGKIERLLRDARVTAQWGSAPSADDVRKRDDLRLLEDEALVSPVSEGEQEMVARLLAEHGPEKIAAAFLRSRRAELSAPEELMEADPPRAKREPSAPRPRSDFEGGDWIALSIGHEQRADVRWLLPMLCNAAGFTKQDVGAIRIRQNETHVSLAPGGAARLMEAAGPDRRLEKGIRVAVLPGNPEADYRSGGDERPKRGGPERAGAKGRGRPSGPPHRGKGPGKGGPGKGPNRGPGAGSRGPGGGAGPRKRPRD